MRPGIKFYTKLEETSLEPKKYNKELKEAGLSGKDILFTERKERSGNYIVFFENNGIYEYHPYDNVNGLSSGQKARTLEGCISRAHCMGLFENDTGVAKPMKAADGLLDVKVNFKESLRNRLREGAVCPSAMEDCMTEYMSQCEEEGYTPDADDVLEHLEDSGFDPTGYEDAIREFVSECCDDCDDCDDFEDFDESNKTSKNRLREKMYTDELSDQLESDILSAANENADGPHVALTDVLETLEYEYGYNYKGELYPNLSVIVKYLEQSGYIVEE